MRKKKCENKMKILKATINWAFYNEHDIPFHPSNKHMFDYKITVFGAQTKNPIHHMYIIICFEHLFSVYSNNLPMCKRDR